MTKNYIITKKLKIQKIVVSLFFIEALENKIMGKLKRLGVKVWLRNVDDTFVVLKSKVCVEKVLEFLNKQHPNIKFTVECENKNSLPF